MSTWLDLSRMSGYYQSENIPLSLDGDGSLSTITWTATTPAGTSVDIYTSISFNGGYDWTDWKKCTQGGTIPDIQPDTSLGSVLFRFRAFLKSQIPNIRPILSEIQLVLEPVIVFDNKGDTYCQPEIWITMNENGDFSLTNLSKNNEEFKFTGLVNGETVYVNSEREYIETSLAATYRYSNFNDNYFNLPIGKNVFRVSGKAKIVFRYQFKLI